MKNGPPASAGRGIIFFGGYDPEYPRNAIIRQGCARLGLIVSECLVAGSRKVTTRYPLLLREIARCGARRDFPLFVPDFRHKDVPLAWLVARASGRRLIFDPLVSRYETRVLDRADAAAGSLQARHNRNIDRISMRAADLVLADTDAHADFFRSEFGLRPERVRTLRLGYDDTVFSVAPLNPSGGVFKVLFYGSFLPLHGVETIADAAVALAGRGFHFTIVGEGQTRPRLIDRARSINGTGMTLSKHVAMERLPELIHRSDAVLGIFGTTSKARMVIPNKVYQALAAGRPVVTADTPAVREIFSDGVHLLTVPAGDSRALAAALIRLRDERELARAITAAGGELVRRDYNPPRIAGRLAKILDQEGLW